MNLINESLVPFVGTEHFKLYTSLSDIKSFLKVNSIDFSVEIWENKECTVPMPWKIIHIDDTISLFFANDKLFKIVVFNKYTGSTGNGIKIGMHMSTAMKKDYSLHYDDWNEDYETDGYWIEEDENGLISSISIFIPEVLNDEEFDSYKW